MRYIFTSFGSRGDLQPTLALAQALANRGHEVVVIGPPNFSEIAARLKIQFVGAGDDMQGILEREKRYVKASPFVLLREMKRILFEQVDKVTRVVDPLITPGSVVVASAISLAASSFAKARKCPYFYIALQPQLFRSSGLPPPVFPQGLRLPPGINRVIFRGHDALWTRLVAPMFARLHSKLGLPPVRDMWRHMLGPNPILASDPVLIGSIDPRLPQSQGCVMLADDRPLPEKLDAFLSRGSAPVYVGFGSMPDEAPEESARTILTVARDTGTRLVLSSGWANLQASDNDDVCMIGDVSHATLFGRVRAVVHHGGAGTTARAALSGVPQLIVPHMLDQYYWGMRIQALGLGPKPLPRTHLNATAFARSLSTVLAANSFASNAREIALRMIPDGLNRIVRLLEEPQTS